MIRKISLLALGLALVGIAKAQDVVDFEHGKSETFVMGHAGTTDCHVSFRNLSGSKISLVYNKIADDFPSGWWVSFCDNYNCYANFINQDTFAPIADSGYAEFKISVTPNGLADTATVKYEIWSAATPNVKDTVTFVFMVQWGAGLHEEISSAFHVYPNPALDKISFSGIIEETTLSVFNSQGASVLKSNIGPSNTELSVADLPKGVYFVSYNTSSGLVRGSFVKQ